MSFKFASNRKSILKILLQRVLVQRKQVRQKQKAYKKTDFQYHVLEGQQLALKVTANSVYGAIALKDPCIGACITAKGREMLQKVKYEAEVNFSTYLQSLTWTQRDVDDKIPSAIMGEPVCSQPLRIQAIGGDTDSVFIKFHGATINQAISWCMKGSDYFSSFFADTIKMEYEKVWCPYIAIAKKKGVGKEYTHDDTKYEITYKGMETKRRNYCAFLKETLLEVIQIVIHDAEKGPHKAVAYVDDQLYIFSIFLYVANIKIIRVKFLANQVPLQKLLISGRLKDSYRQNNNAVLDLVNRMKLRKDYDIPAVGVRFEYLYVKRDTPHQYQKSETLEFALKHSIEPDVVFYMESQFTTPLVGFLQHTGVGKQLERCLAKKLAKARAQKANLTPITEFFKKRTAMS